MLSWIMGVQRKIRTGEIRARTGVANISERFREAQLRRVKGKT